MREVFFVVVDDDDASIVVADGVDVADADAVVPIDIDAAAAVIVVADVIVANADATTAAAAAAAISWISLSIFEILYYTSWDYFFLLREIIPILSPFPGATPPSFATPLPASVRSTEPATT